MQRLQQDALVRCDSLRLQIEPVQVACPAQKDQALALRSVHENKVLERVRVDLLEIEQLVPDDVEYFRVRLRLVLDPAVLSGRRESDVLDFALELVGRVLYYALLW